MNYLCCCLCIRLFLFFHHERILLTHFFTTTSILWKKKKTQNDSYKYIYFIIYKNKIWLNITCLISQSKIQLREREKKKIESKMKTLKLLGYNANSIKKIIPILDVYSTDFHGHTKFQSVWFGLVRFVTNKSKIESDMITIRIILFEIHSIHIRFRNFKQR